MAADQPVCVPGRDAWPAHALLVYARYDLTFPVDLSRDRWSTRMPTTASPHDVAALPCGHYSSGMAPFKFLDAYLLIRYLRRKLL